MDSLTQVVLGAAVGEATLGRRIGYRAMVWGAIVGTIPDLDVFMRLFTDSVTAREMHRGFSHSIIFSLLFAPILAWIAMKIHKKREWDVSFKRWTLMFFLALVTHPLLDAHTVWGTQLFWPIDYRLAYKNIFVVDPLYTIPFLIFLLLALFQKRDNPMRSKYNNAGLIISSLYMILTLIFKWVAQNEFVAQMEDQHIEYTEIDTKPTPLNSILWMAQIQTDKGFRVAYYSLFDTKPIVFSEEIPQNKAYIKDMMDEKIIKQLIHISEGWYFIEAIDGHLYFTDIRFGQLGVENNDPFFWRYELYRDKDGKLQTDMAPEKLGRSGEMKIVMGKLWERLKGN